MPIAVAGAAVAIGVAAADVAAVGLTLVTALEVVAAVGATIGAIGVLTGNKDLALAGAALGIVGGVGAIAGSAGLLGADATTSLFGTQAAASTADAAAPAGTDIGAQVAQSATDTGSSTGAAAATATPTTTPDIVDSFSGQVSLPAPGLPNVADTGNASDIVSSANPDSPSLINTPAPSATTAPPSANLSATPPTQAGIPQGAGAAPAAPGVAAPAAPTAPVTGTNAPTITPAAASPVTGAPATGASATASPGTLQSLLGVAKDNPLLTFGLTQAGGSLLSGLFSPVTPAQVSALNAQANQNNAAAALTQQQLANIQQPLPVASRTPPTQQTPVPANVTGSTGLINSPA